MIMGVMAVRLTVSKFKISRGQRSDGSGHHELDNSLKAQFRTAIKFKYILNVFSALAKVCASECLLSSSVVHRYKRFWQTVCCRRKLITT